MACSYGPVTGLLRGWGRRTGGRPGAVPGGHRRGLQRPEAAEIVGITYRQLDYWARTDLVRPSLADAKGSGSRRRYSYRDLLELKMIKKLLDAGIKLETVRDVFDLPARNVGDDITSAPARHRGHQRRARATATS